MRLGYCLMALVCMLQIAYGVCVKIDVSKDLFYSDLSQEFIYTEQSPLAFMKKDTHLKISSKFQKDVRTRYVPFLPDNWTRNSLTGEVEPIQQALEDYSPYSIMIEYSDDKSSGVLVQRQIKSAGLIEVCQMVNREFRTKKGVKENIRQHIRGNKIFRKISVSLRISGSLIDEVSPDKKSRRPDELIECGSFYNIAPSEIDIFVDRVKSDRNDWPPTKIVCDVKPQLSR